MTEETSHIITPEGMKDKMTLEGMVIEYAQKERDIDPMIWAVDKNYSKYFRQLWETGDIAARYHEAMDQHPENLAELVSWIQDEIERRAALSRSSGE